MSQQSESFKNVLGGLSAASFTPSYAKATVSSSFLQLNPSKPRNMNKEYLFS